MENKPPDSYWWVRLNRCWKRKGKKKKSEWLLQIMCSRCVFGEGYPPQYSCKKVSRAEGYETMKRIQLEACFGYPSFPCCVEKADRER